MEEAERIKDDFIHIPRDWLTPKVLADQAMLKMVLYVATEISINGFCEISSGRIQAMFGVSRQKFREFLKKTNSQPTRNQLATKIEFENQLIRLSQQPTHNQLTTNSQPTSRRKRAEKFVPPTEQEAADYVSEKGYHFNPAEFVSWNQSKGWKVGDQPMKDWKAACATWEQRWKQKYGERFYYQIGAKHSDSDRQKDRYSDLESAAETILRHTENLDSYFNDKG